MRHKFKTIVVLLPIAIILSAVSCQDSGSDEYYLEINNEELEREIIDFIEECKNISIKRDFTVSVHCKDLNDSIKRYTLLYEPQAVLSCYHFICKVGDRDVLFYMNAGQDNSWQSFFEQKEFAWLDMMKRNFPDEYDARKEERVFPIMLYHGPNRYLTFLNGKLINVTNMPGLTFFDRINIKVNGKDMRL